MLSFIIYKSIMCVAIFAVSLGIAAYSTWWERKFAGLLQDRWGPSRAGWWGLLQRMKYGVVQTAKTGQKKPMRLLAQGVVIRQFCLIIRYMLRAGMMLRLL